MLVGTAVAVLLVCPRRPRAAPIACLVESGYVGLCAPRVVFWVVTRVFCVSDDDFLCCVVPRWVGHPVALSFA